MIKKNTKIIFEGEENEKLKNLEGGIPLSKGETIKIIEKGKSQSYQVKDKIIECNLNGSDQIINITYILKRK